MKAVDETKIFIHKLTLNARVGVHPHEKQVPQPVIFTVEAHTEPLSESTHRDHLANVVCYDQLVARVQRVLDRGHVHLLETLAERVARECLRDKQIRNVRVRAEKPEAIPAAQAAGVEIHLSRA